jgi:TonB family protein
MVRSPERSVIPLDEIRHIVFIARGPEPSGGGGGGGNRQAGPIRRAEGIGTDRMTLRTTRTLPSDSWSASGSVLDADPLPRVLLDAKPLAAGTADVAGLPYGGIPFGLSTGPGSGGGVGTGIGTGIGSGRGPGVGPGSGGGMGGGVYHPGGTVTTPRVITEVKPTYTSAALLHRVQGTVVLELIVRSDGCPSEIRVVRSLDPGGLDDQAKAAASQWRFEPGRVNGKPVDVLVTLMLDFWIQ